MQFLIGMQIVQTHQQFPHDDCDVFLGDQAWLHEVATTTARTEFHDDPEVGALEERPMILGDKRGVELGQNGYLLDNIFNLIFSILDIDNFDSHGLSGTSVNPGIYQTS